MMIRTSLSPSDVTPAAYLLPSAMSLSRRAATRGSTTPIRTPLLWRSAGCPRACSSTASPGLTWASSRGWGEVGQEREAGLAGLLDEDADGRLAPLSCRHGLLAGLDEQHLEAVDVALGDPVGRDRARGPSGSARARRPARPAPRAPWPAGSPPRRPGPSSSSLRFVSAASAHWAAAACAIAWSASWRFSAGLVDRASGRWLDFGEGHEGVVLSGRAGSGRARSWASPSAATAF